MTAVLLFLGIVASGIMTILGIIFTAICFAYSKRSKFLWLAIFIVSMFSLFTLIWYATLKTTEAATSFQRNLQQSMVNGLPPDAAEKYHMADSVGSMQVQLLKLYEPASVKGNVPAQFYHYLGFGTYYRLPLTYPYSIHCDDSPAGGSLFSEEDVEHFNENDNGEKDCGITNITAFDFDGNMLLAEALAEPGKEKSWLIYDFRSRKTEWFESKQMMEAAAVKQGFGRKPVLIGGEDYFRRLLGQKSN